MFGGHYDNRNITVRVYTGVGSEVFDEFYILYSVLLYVRGYRSDNLNEFVTFVRYLLMWYNI